MDSRNMSMSGGWKHSNWWDSENSGFAGLWTSVGQSWRGMPRRSSSSIMRLRASHSRNFWAAAASPLTGLWGKGFGCLVPAPMVLLSRIGVRPPRVQQRSLLGQKTADLFHGAPGREATLLRSNLRNDRESDASHRGFPETAPVVSFVVPAIRRPRRLTTLDGVRGWCDTGAEPSGGGACRPRVRVPDTSIVPLADGFQPLVSGEAGLLVPETGLPEPSRIRPEAGGLSYSVGAPRPQPQATMRPNGQLRTAHGVRGAAVRRRHHGAQLAGFDRAPQAAVNYLLDAALAAHHGPAFQNLLLKTGEGIPAGDGIPGRRSETGTLSPR